MTTKETATHELFALFCSRMKPDPDRNLLLCAALGQQDNAVDSWRRRYSRMGLECADDGEFQLLPLVFSNLQGHGYAGSEMSRLRGVYCQAWYRNQLLLGATIQLSKHFSDAGISSVLTGGLPIIARYYTGKSLRTVRQGELLVGVGQVKQAAEILVAEGWRLLGPARPFPTRCDELYRHVAIFESKSSHTTSQLKIYKGDEGMAAIPRSPASSDQALRVQLRWKLIDPECALRGDVADGEDSRLPASQRWSAQQGSFRMLERSACFVEACLRAFPHDPASVSWMADAWMILTQGSVPFDWEIATALAAKHHVLPLFALARCCLRDMVARSVEEGPLSVTSAQDVGRGTQVVHPSELDTIRFTDRLTRTSEEQTIVQRVQKWVHMYLQTQRGDWFERLIRFPGFLACCWNGDRVKRFLARLLRAA